jgi:hypothetical protein
MEKIHGRTVESHRHCWAVVPCVVAPLLYPPPPPTVLTPLPSLADPVPTEVVVEARNVGAMTCKGSLCMRRRSSHCAPTHPRWRLWRPRYGKLGGVVKKREKGGWGMRGGRGRQLGVGALGNGRGFVQKWLRAFFAKEPWPRVRARRSHHALNSLVPT